jgi:hypothetical protein
MILLGSIFQHFQHFQHFQLKVTTKSKIGKNKQKPFFLMLFRQKVNANKAKIEDEMKTQFMSFPTFTSMLKKISRIIPRVKMIFPNFKAERDGRFIFLAFLGNVFQ